MNRDREIEIRKEYVEKVLALALKPKKGFNAIQYGRDKISDREFIRIMDYRGTALTLEVTAMSLEGILAEVSKYAIIGIVGKHSKVGQSDCAVYDEKVLLDIAPLFAKTGLA